MRRIVTKITLPALFYVLLLSGHAFAYNAFEIAKSIGCNSQADIDDLVLSIPVNSYQSDEILNPENHKNIKFIWEKIKNTDRENYQPKNMEAYKFSASIANLKSRCKRYFEQYEKLSAYIKEQQDKIDIFSFLENLNIPANHDDLKDWLISHRNYTKDDVRNPERCQSVNSFINAMDNKKVKDFNISDQERKELVRLVIGMPHQLGFFSRDCERIAKEDQKEKSFRENAPSDLINTFAGTQKLKSFDLYKEIISYIDDWKFKAKKAHDRTVWEFYSNITKPEDKDTIFLNPPINAGMYEGQYFFIEAKITRDFEGKYVLNSYWAGEQYEALAEISKQTLKKSVARFNQKFYFVGNLKDVMTVQTVGGSSKPICILKVIVMADSNEFNDFMKYISGHPDEFPHEKYVEIIF